MKTPGWSRGLLRFLAPRDRVDEVLGDMEETHRTRIERRGHLVATILTGLETLDMGVALLRGRLRRSRPPAPARPEAPVEGALSGAGVSLLDFKLGFRMLVKYPGLTVVAGLAIAFAFAIGTGTFEFATDFLYPSLPLDQGDRIVEVYNRNAATGSVDPRALHHFFLWRQEVQSVDEMGAFQDRRRNLVAESGVGRPLLGAEMTATAFGIARVPPLLGRPISESAEGLGAPNVVVIGYEVWQTVLGGDLDVVGQTVRLGSDHATVVGVMPEGFGYPRSHSFWVPLRLNVLDYAWGESPSVRVVARLAPGVTLEEAQTEFSAIGLRTANDHPQTREHLRPELLRFGRPAFSSSNLLLKGLYFMTLVFFAMLMLLVCANVALLLFARTAARQSEIVVRSALGASRGRIVGQLFAEALVLAAVSAAVGLWGAQLGLQWVVGLLRTMEGGAVGFWFGTSLSPGTLAYALIFTLLAAGAAGIVPALKATGHGVQPQLQRSGAGRGGLEFGRIWTVVIVTQIAVTVAFMPIVILIGNQTAEINATDVGFRADEYLSVRLIKDRESSLAPAEPGELPDLSEGWETYTEFKRRLVQEPGVTAVALATSIPGANHALRRIEVDGPSSPRPSPNGHRVATVSVDMDFFGALGVPILSGRNFHAADMEPGQNIVIVNEDFARVVLEDRNPIGRRVAYANPGRDPGEEPGPWYEIVGVVKQIAMQTDPDLSSGAGIYHVLRPAENQQLRMVIHVGPDPASFSRQLQALAQEVDPTLLLFEIRPLDEGAWQTELLYESWFWVILAAGGIALLLSLAGIYSIMSFTVSRRTREIGVRVALGADRRRIVAAIFSRALTQVGLGVLAGGVLFLGVAFVLSEGSIRPGGREFLITGAYMTVMLAVCLLACIVPTRRALGIEPTEALKAE